MECVCVCGVGGWSDGSGVGAPIHSLPTPPRHASGVAGWTTCRAACASLLRQRDWIEIMRECTRVCKNITGGVRLFMGAEVWPGTRNLPRYLPIPRVAQSTDFFSFREPSACNALCSFTHITRPRQTGPERNGRPRARPACVPFLPLIIHAFSPCLAHSSCAHPPTHAPTHTQALRWVQRAVHERESGRV